MGLADDCLKINCEYSGRRNDELYESILYSLMEVLNHSDEQTLRYFRLFGNYFDPRILNVSLEYFRFDYKGFNALVYRRLVFACMVAHDESYSGGRDCLAHTAGYYWVSDDKDFLSDYDLYLFNYFMNILETHSWRSWVSSIPDVLIRYLKKIYASVSAVDEFIKFTVDSGLYLFWSGDQRLNQLCQLLIFRMGSTSPGLISRFINSIISCPAPNVRNDSIIFEFLDREVLSNIR